MAPVQGPTADSALDSYAEGILEKYSAELAGLHQPPAIANCHLQSRSATCIGAQIVKVQVYFNSVVCGILEASKAICCYALNF